MFNRVPSGAVGDLAMESGDWRAQLQADSRQRIENKILNILKRNLPFTRRAELQELKIIAERIEEEIYTAATSQSEYSRKMCFMMLTMETRLQKLMSDPLRSNSAALYKTENPLVPLDSTANGGDWQEEVYQKIKAMKDVYLLDLNKRLDRTDDAIRYMMTHEKVVSKLHPEFQYPLRESPPEAITLEYIVERSDHQDATIRYMMTQHDISIPEFFRAPDDQGTSTGGDASTGDDPN